MANAESARRRAQVWNASGNERTALQGGWLWDPVRVTHGVRMCWLHPRMAGLGVEGYVPPLRSWLTPFPRVKPMLIPWDALSNPRVGRASLLGRVTSLFRTTRLVELAILGTELKLLVSWTTWEQVVAPMLGWKGELGRGGLVRTGTQEVLADLIREKSDASLGHLPCCPWSPLYSYP